MSVHATYPPQGHTTMLPPPYTTVSPPGNGVKICTVVFGVLGLLIWSTSIGFLIGWGYGYYAENPSETRIFYGNFLSIPANAAMIYATSRIIFLVLESDFPRPGSLQDLNQCVSRLVTFTMLSFTGWITSIIWLSIYNTDNFKVYHACNYGYLIGAVVAGCAGSLAATTKKALLQTQKVHGAAPKSSGPHSQTYHNQAYGSPYPA